VPELAAGHGVSISSTALPSREGADSRNQLQQDGEAETRLLLQRQLDRLARSGSSRRPLLRVWEVPAGVSGFQAAAFKNVAIRLSGPSDFVVSLDGDRLLTDAVIEDTVESFLSTSRRDMAGSPKLCPVLLPKVSQSDRSTAGYYGMRRELFDILGGHSEALASPWMEDIDLFRRSQAFCAEAEVRRLQESKRLAQGNPVVSERDRARIRTVAWMDAMELTGIGIGFVVPEAARQLQGQEALDAIKSMCKVQLNAADVLSGRVPLLQHIASASTPRSSDDTAPVEGDFASHELEQDARKLDALLQQMGEQLDRAYLLPKVIARLLDARALELSTPAWEPDAEEALVN